MSELVYSQKSINDLRSIANYTAGQWSEQQAIRYYNMLIEGCEQIARQGGSIGVSYHEIRPGLYGFHCARHIIFYRIVSNEKVRIVRILHERMDFERHL